MANYGGWTTGGVSIRSGGGRVAHFCKVILFSTVTTCLVISRTVLGSGGVCAWSWVTAGKLPLMLTQPLLSCEMRDWVWGCVWYLHTCTRWLLLLLLMWLWVWTAVWRQRDLLRGLHTSLMSPTPLWGLATEQNRKTVVLNFVPVVTHAMVMASVRRRA